jgi:putative restriction endonuclease
MRFWWVNQNRTYRHEVEGGFLWSPKRKKGGRLHPFYETMREVSPGDLVFSFAGTRIRAFGLARSHAFEAPKPLEFGAAGRNWDEIGWRVEVAFHEIATQFRPADWIEVLRPLLPPKYSPLLPDGRGSQSIYLTELPRPLALQLADLIGSELAAIARSEMVFEPELAAPNAEQALWEEHLRQRIEQDATLATTEKEALVLSRRGQGPFRQRVQQIESRCWIQGQRRASIFVRPPFQRASRRLSTSRSYDLEQAPPHLFCSTGRQGAASRSFSSRP